MHSKWITQTEKHHAKNVPQGHILLKQFICKIHVMDHSKRQSLHHQVTRDVLTLVITMCCGNGQMMNDNYINAIF